MYNKGTWLSQMHAHTTCVCVCVCVRCYVCLYVMHVCDACVDTGVIAFEMLYGILPFQRFVSYEDATYEEDENGEDEMIDYLS